MRKSGFTLSINPDKTQHYLSVALFAVKGRGQGWVLRGRVELSARGYQAPTIRTLFAHKPNQFNRQIVLKPSKGNQNKKPSVCILEQSYVFQRLFRLELGSLFK